MTKEIKGQKEFNEYLERIPTKDNPFECPNLRVLPEDINFRDNIICSHDYSEGTLICKNSSELDGHAMLDHYCGVFGRVYTRNGKIFVGYNSHKRKTLEIEIKILNLANGKK
ncbi:MAG: hypothetical protein PVJ67_01220 [Candidatus Pacearchaeota archaeon]